MGLFSRRYQPNGEHHLRITDGQFESAGRIMSEKGVSEFRDLAQKEGCLQFEAPDFPVSRILGTFVLSYQSAEEAAGVPQGQRMFHTELNRKDLVAFNEFIESYNDRVGAHNAKLEREEKDIRSKGLGGMLFSMAAKAATEQIKKSTSGKTADVRTFEKEFADYICGDSPKAKEYLLGFARMFGGNDEGVVAVAAAIRKLFWVQEFVRYNRKAQ